MARHQVWRFQHQVHPASHFEFFQQSGDVKFHRSHGDVQLAGYLFVGQVLRDGAEHLVLTPAERHGQFGLRTTAGELLGAAYHTTHQIFAERDHYVEVSGISLACDALNGQQTGGLILWKGPVIGSFNLEAPHSGFPVEENESLRVHSGIRRRSVA